VVVNNAVLLMEFNHWMFRARVLMMHTVVNSKDVANKLCRFQLRQKTARFIPIINWES